MPLPDHREKPTILKASSCCSFAIGTTHTWFDWSVNMGVSIVATPKPTGWTQMYTPRTLNSSCPSGQHDNTAYQTNAAPQHWSEEATDRSTSCTQDLLGPHIESHIISGSEWGTNAMFLMSIHYSILLFLLFFSVLVTWLSHLTPSKVSKWFKTQLAHITTGASDFLD